MGSRTFGYIRVSGEDQNEARQVSSMKKEGIEERDIYIEKKTGKNFNREQYQLLKRNLREGDMLVIHSIDRLGRNYTAIKDEWQDITKNINADIKVLDMPLLDTSKRTETLMDNFISDIVLQILCYCAENEIRTSKIRQKEGIDARRAKGLPMGRLKIEAPPDFPNVYKSWRNGEITAKTAMNELNLKRTTFYSLVKEYESAL